MIRKSTRDRRFLTQFLLASLLLLSSAFGFEMSDSDPIGTMESSPNSESDNSKSGEFSVLTYNIAGLPELISSASTKRAPSIAEIGRRINQFDIVNVQEDFNYNKNLYNSGNCHPYRTQTKGGVPFGDGLNTLSKFPVSRLQRISWNNCTGADCLTPKGFTYSRLEIAKNVFVDLYNVHANAYNHISAAEARRKNIIQLSEFISTHSKGEAVIVMGDLNAHYGYYYDNIQNLLNANSLTDAWLTLMHNDILPTALKQLPANDILQLENDAETIDKILFRSSDRIKFMPSRYRLENMSFNNNAGRPLSDHHPVSLVFNWKLNDVNVGQDILAANK